MKSIGKVIAWKKVGCEGGLDSYVSIGDSINDWEAAQTNGLHFYGYNGSEEVMALTTCSLHYQ